MAEIKTERLDGYRRLIEIARDLASTLDLDVLLERIVRAAAEVTHSEAASILLYDNLTRQLYFQVATDLDEPTLRGKVLPLDGSFAGWIVLNRKSVRIADVREDPRFFDNVDRVTGRPTKSLLGVPLITKNKVVGVLEALNKQKGNFTEGDESIFSVLGAQAAVAIENARLFQQSDLISEFVHELRTPLASLSTATYLLLQPEMAREQREQIINNIHTETLRLNSMTASFLDLARLESGRVQFRRSAFNVADLLIECRDIMSSKAQEEQVEVRIEGTDGLPPWEVDRDKLKQVVLNLLSNAIKYNRPGGSVVLSALAQESSSCISVQDTGAGIPEEDIPHLFEKFYRVHEMEGRVSGTGLGLSICKEIVQGHGGRMEVMSKLGEGTTFSVFLPRSGRTQPHGMLAALSGMGSARQDGA
ncbi:MAG: GAF domain-containing sensor histidine kinase [Chloroflexota bacterium]